MTFSASLFKKKLKFRISSLGIYYLIMLWVHVLSLRKTTKIPKLPPPTKLNLRHFYFYHLQKGGGRGGRIKYPEFRKLSDWGREICWPKGWQKFPLSLSLQTIQAIELEGFFSFPGLLETWAVAETHGRQQESETKNEEERARRYTVQYI